MLKHVSKTFEVNGKSMPALESVDLEVAAGTFTALVGPSGCGKSTVLNMVAGLFAPSSGEVLYDGHVVTRLNHQVGYMTQKDTLLPWRTVRDNIALPLEMKRRDINQKDRGERVADMIELVGLKGFGEHFPAQLSGGMRKRVQLARMLVYRPETLLMDEPFAALDAQMRTVMHGELMRLTELQRATVIFVTHDLAEAITLADKVAVFTGRPGRIKLQRDIPIARPRDPFKVRFDDAVAGIQEELWDQLREELQ
ncbi:ABC transporter ATP-binding protein [Bosea caraganae]|uniref:ABC transporter ATP-binding protein n=2 Tax=Bosea caraganae TaxID=2763117 RepID=A0A370LAK8_9HYPH|nr:ABC transporter ATP-binding protein [Bosea caraganae]RDJ28332.1 ABC transporter ATP-binding protein [Bosea caraganae]